MFKRCLIVLLLFCSFLAGAQSIDSLAKGMAATKKFTGNAVKEVAKAKALLAKINAEARTIENLDFSMTYDLPVALNKNLGGIDFAILIDSIWFDLDKNANFLNAYMVLEIPGETQRLSFKGESIRFDEKGIDASQAKMTLLEDVSIRFGTKNILRFKADGNSYVSFTCEGFERLGISAEIEFSPDLLLKEDSEGNVSPNEHVIGTFKTECGGWSEMLTEISLPRFQVAALPGFGFSVEEAIIDQSTVSNGLAMVFPKNYEHPAANSILWEGIYINKLSVRLPPNFKTTDGTATTLKATTLIIDEMGVSGIFEAKQVISLEKGKIATWQFSLDSLGIEVQANQIRRAAFSGRIIVPVVDKEDPLKYAAIIEDGANYSFVIKNTGEINMSAFSARIVLAPNSSLTIATRNKEFLPSCNLTGRMTVGASESGTALADIQFINLQIQTVSPFIAVDKFTFTSSVQQKMANFPVQIDNIGLTTSGDDVGLVFDVTVNLVGSGDGGYSGTAGLIVWATNRQGTGGINNYSFKSIQLTSIAISIDGGTFSVRGGLDIFKNDPVYGFGYKGRADAIFKPSIRVAVTAQFGHINNYSYFYLDAMAGFPKGISIADGFAIYGFSGGAYYHMNRQVKNNLLPPTTSVAMSETDVKQAGKSLSGISYVPDGSKGIGIRAKVFCGTSPSPDLFNGDAGFEITFNAGGGVSRIMFEGNGYLLSEMYKGDEKAPMKASFLLDMNFNEVSLYGQAEVYLNIKEVVKGTGTNNKAGTVCFYFSLSEWYVYAGHPDPDKRLGLEFAKLFKTSSYFCAGSKVPNMPNLPDEVSEILGTDLSLSRDVDALKKAGGMIFGSSMSFHTPDLSFLMFYADLSGKAGFDVMLRQLGTDLVCSNTGQTIGINGWYAGGQVYAYIRAQIGINVDIFAVSGKFPILDASAAAILQAKLPNPTWMRGIVGGQYNILGGLVKGRCKFQFELGEKCQLQTASPLEGVKVISECSPASDAQEVDVFNAPQAPFSVEIDKAFEFTNQEGIKKTFRVKYDYFKLLDGTKEIAGEVQWNTGHDVAVFNSHEILPPQKALTLQVQVHFEELAGSNWQTVVVNNVTAKESFSSTFKTGNAPTTIPPGNVLYSYPMPNQVNFYPKESSKGYIQLKTGQEYLFTPGSQWKQVARFVSATGKKEFSFSYDAGAKRLNFTQPSAVTNETVYNLVITNVPAQANAALDKNVTAKADVRMANTDTNKTTIEVQTKDVEGKLDLLQETALYNSWFRTSKYNTFTAKMDAATMGEPWRWQLFAPVNELIRNITLDEYFDKMETGGTASMKPFIQLETDITNDWYKKDIQPLIYVEFPFSINWRVIDELGRPPIRTGQLSQIPNDIEMDANQQVTGAAGAHNAAFINLASYYYYKDYDNLSQQSANYLLKNAYPNVINLLSNFYPIERPGDYKMKVKYVLPGESLANSEKEIVIRRE